MAGAQDAVPKIVGGNNRQPDRLASLLRHRKGLRKKMLLDAAKELIGVEFVFAGSRAAQQADVQNNNIAASGLDAIEDIAQMIEIEMIAHRHENVARSRAHRLRASAQPSNSKLN